MNWGTGIFITFVVFMGIIITMVVISMKQDINLVASDYYKQELAYQDQIDKMQNATDNSDEVTFNYLASKGQFVMSSKVDMEGEAHFYRPSDATKDLKVNFDLKMGSNQVINTEGMDKGLWKVKLTWTKDTKLYYAEKSIVI